MLVFTFMISLLLRKTRTTRSGGWLGRVFKAQAGPRETRKALPQTASGTLATPQNVASFDVRLDVHGGTPFSLVEATAARDRPPVARSGNWSRDHFGSAAILPLKRASPSPAVTRHGGQKKHTSGRNSLFLSPVSAFSTLVKDSDRALAGFNTGLHVHDFSPFADNLNEISGWMAGQGLRAPG
jgi:hypothetical protein